MRGCQISKRSSVTTTCRGSFELNFKNLVISLGFIFFILGVFYLYQVNDLATKGYEIRDIEKQIASLSQVNKDNRIKEVELKSMYNIEKTAQSLNLVSTKEITYLNLSGEVAMK
jgi:cell division protein FtsL